jgi:hypothetical protein
METGCAMHHSEKVKGLFFTIFFFILDVCIVVLQFLYILNAEVLKIENVYYTW